MKKVLALGLAVASFGAVASDRNIWDLQYLPNKGTAYGNTQATYTSGKLDFKSSSAKVDISAMSYAQTVGYSVTDMLLLSASINYTDLKFDGKSGATDNSSHGWSDPSLDGRYRLLDDAFRLDILAGYAFATGASTNRNMLGLGDFNYNGGPRVYLGVEAGQKLTSMQYSIKLQADEVFKSDVRDEAGKTRNDSHVNWTLQGQLLNNLSEKLFLRSHASFRAIAGYDDNKDGSTAPITEYRLGTGLQYAMSANLLGDIGVTYRNIQQDSGTIDSFDMWMWTVGARYQF